MKNTIYYEFIYAMGEKMEDPNNNMQGQMPHEEQMPPPEPPESEGYQEDNRENTYVRSYNPDVDTLKNLVHIAGVIALIFAILGIIGAIFTLGITLVAAIINLLIWHFSKKINNMIDQKKYSEAKNKTLLWAILGIVLGGVIPGILLLLAYLKFEEIMRTSQPPVQNGTPP